MGGPAHLQTLGVDEKEVVLIGERTHVGPLHLLVGGSTETMKVEDEGDGF